MEANSIGGQPSGAEPQQTFQHARIIPQPGIQANPTRYAVSIISHRSRLCDPDNLCAKYFVDGLRYAQIIVDDTAAIVDYRIRQQKAAKGEERTEIIIERI